MMLALRVAPVCAGDDQANDHHQYGDRAEA